MEIRVDGVLMPSADVYGVEYQPIGAFERNANGNLVGDLVAVKATLTLGWRMLDDVSFKRILGAGEPLFAQVEYYDPKIGQRVTKVMHAMPKGGKVQLAVGGAVWWKDVACVFVER